MDPSNPNNNKASRFYDPVRDVFTMLEPTNPPNIFADPNSEVYIPSGNVPGGSVSNPVNQAANPIPNGMMDPDQASSSTKPSKICSNGSCRRPTTRGSVCDNCRDKKIALRERRISEGMCANCGQNPAQQDSYGRNSKNCSQCLEKRRVYQADFKAKKEAAEALIQLSRG